VGEERPLFPPRPQGRVPVPMNPVNSYNIAIPISIPAAQFNNFEKAVNNKTPPFSHSLNMITTSPADAYATKSVIASHNNTQLKNNNISRARFALPSLVNANV